MCGSALFFENSVCVTCGTGLAYSRDERDIVPVDASGRFVDGDGLVWHVCRNLGLSGCSWLARFPGGQCSACDLTRTRPNDQDAAGIASFPIAERAKRHLLAELDGLGIPVIGRAADPRNGLCFDLLSSTNENVVIGHDDGVITIDLAEGDDAYRGRMRAQLAEPYRTMLGHFRHEIGHYYQWQLTGDRIDGFRRLFGDEREDYQAAIDRHYTDGPPPDWQASFLSAYATMHPHEDFAETWAHFLHITDTIETAVEFRLIDAVHPHGADSFGELVTTVWSPLATALNMVNRSMGRDDLYPFTLPEPVRAKLDFVAALADGASRGRWPGP